MHLRRFLPVLLFISSSSLASPWIGSLDESLHEDLRTLVAYDAIDAVVISYPVPWRGIGSQLEQIDIDQLPSAAQNAAIRLLHYYSKQQEGRLRQVSSVYGATDPTRFTGFDQQQGQSAIGSHQIEGFSGRWSGQLKANWQSGGDTHLDGSYLAYHLGDWVVRAGAVNQWWGPAHGSSLILSTNARPIPTVGLFRGSAVQSETKWLSWLGPWYASAEVGKMESEREVANPRIWRARFTAKPLSGLTIGASWVAMWGGEGQPSSFGDFVDVITFRTQCINGLETCDPELETTNGNHIAGWDVQYTFNLLNRPWSIYGQRIGEDAVDSVMVTDSADLVGISTFVGPIHVFVEHSDTNVACNGADSPATNCYYEHSTYRNGYRYYGRAVGSTFDSDAEQLTVGVKWQSTTGKTAGLSITQVELNLDGNRPSPVLDKEASEKGVFVSAYYQQPWNNWLIKVGATAAQREFTRVDENDFSAYAEVRYAWGD